MHHFSEIRVEDSRVELPDCFDFNAARQLIRKIKAIPKNELPPTLHIDCRRTRHIDTAGLGCLLVIGDYIGANRTMRIEAARAQVGAMLAMARIEERLARPPTLRREAAARATSGDFPELARSATVD